MLRRIWTVAAIIGIVSAITPALAKKNVLAFELEFRPQQTVSAAEAAVHHSMRDRPAELRLTDGRLGDEPEIIGSRTDDDDRLFDLTATNEVLPFVEEVLLNQMQRWGVAAEDGAGLVLEGRLMSFEVRETNQAVGATFVAAVRISFDLKNRAGKVLWTGAAFGDATRYGKKFSNENCNEVLSDALLEAWADLLSNHGLHTAWGGK